jgi:predicted secreted protein
MASTGVINGTNLLIYVNGTAIAGSKSCKLTTTQEVRDCTTKTSAGWRETGEALRTWSMSADGLVALSASTTAFDDLYTLLIVSRTKVHLKFSNETAGDAWWYGDAYCKELSMDAPLEDSTAFTATFEGSGILTQATHT